MARNQYLGIFVMVYYAVLLYALLGLAVFVLTHLNAFWSSFTIIGHTWTAFYIVQFGRLAFLLTGVTGCTVCIVFLCAFAVPFLGTTSTAGLRVVVFFIFFYIIL